MFLPNLFSEAHNMLVTKVYDLAGSLATWNYEPLRDMLDDVCTLENQIACPVRTLELSKLLDSEFEKSQGFDMEELSTVLVEKGFNKGCVFELTQWDSIGFGHVYYLYCESIEELRQYATAIVVYRGTLE